MPPRSNDWIAEEDLARQLGIERERIRAERPTLAAGEFTQQGRAIVWLRTAAVRIANRLGLELPAKKNPPPTPRQVIGLLLEKNPPPGAP